MLMMTMCGRHLKCPLVPGQPQVLQWSELLPKSNSRQAKARFSLLDGQTNGIIACVKFNFTMEQKTSADIDYLDAGNSR